MIVVASGFLLLMGCTKEQRLVQHNLETERFASDVLPDDLLADAVPAGFEFDSVARNGPERHRKDWITVGVRMTGPVDFARAIFYVHPTARAAAVMYERHSQFAADVWEVAQRPRFRDENIPKPFSLKDLAVPNICGAEGAGLYRCHAAAGRIYLVTESTGGGWPPGNETTPEETQAARALIRAFGSVLVAATP